MKPTVFNYAEYETLQAKCNSLEFQNDCLDLSVDSLGKTVSILRSELEKQRMKASANETKLINDVEKFKHKYNGALAELARVKAERDQYKAALQNWHEDSGLEANDAN